MISSHFQLLLYEGLVKLDQLGAILPGQAESFHISADGLTYTFILRETYWSDGNLVTAYDFENGWKAILNPRFPASNAYLLYPIRKAEAAKQGKASLNEVGIIAKNEKTLVVTLERPAPYFLDLISFCTFCPTPSHIHIQNKEHFVSNGRFVLKEWKHNHEIVLTKNPLYWDKERLLPNEIHFSIVGNEATALQMFENREIDMIGDPFSPIPIDALSPIKSEGTFHHCPAPGTTFLAFNTNRPLLSNTKIRKALSYAIDRESIVKNITQMEELIATNIVPPILKKDRDVSFFKDKDLALAKELFEEGLKETGFSKESFDNITYYYTASDRNDKVAQAIQQQWQQALDIQVQLEGVEHKILLDKLTKRDYEIAQTFWLAQYNDPTNILDRFKQKENIKNYSGWENSEYTNLLENSPYTQGKTRLEILEKAEKLLAEEMPVCPIYHWDMPYMIGPHLTPSQISVIESLFFRGPSPFGREKAL